MAEKEESQEKRAMPQIDENEYILRKRLPRRLPKRKNDIYVNRKTNFNAQLERSQKLFDNGYDVVFIHGLGAAINRSINLALQLKIRGLGSLEISVNTSTVELLDDLEPNNDDLEPDTQLRTNSAVHIKVYKLALA
ncbi:ribonuclease P protein subunit p20-like [Saccoglossus kowalevskii]|uniref:Ribonuclease P protein subunit p20 n=1 Tax=Saccoglossus kowalevskii TaxID=10224 RepID=A0ABM0H0F6_SACKO|nr:PREDICTED: ribonuclease P protein subunit p20-like [Saccoglossus kowalevskii]